MESTIGVSPEGPKPRPASTVVILRDADDGLQVLLTVRPRHLRFMGGATVFPGGALADADLDPRWEGLSAIDGRVAAQSLDMDDARPALGAYVCALREAFEEVGFVAGSGPLDELRRDDAEDAHRWLERCLDLGVVLGTDRLVPAGRWVTPLGAPVRFDARFFLARAPDGWQPHPDPEEVEEARWATVTRTLEDLGDGKVLMAPPTVEMLQRLDGLSSVEEALDALSERGIGGRGVVLSTRLSPLVRVVLAPNPGLMTGPGTNTYVVGGGPTFVIDPAVSDGEFVDAVLDAAGEVAAILITHRHMDHVGGIESMVAATGAIVRAFGSEQAGGADVTPIADGENLSAGGARLTALHTPGHASDHLCFLLDGAASLFSGDTILGEGTAVIAPPDGDMAAYLQSLHRLHEQHIDRIYPGHFRPLDGGARVIEGYIAHRAAREDAIVSALRSGAASLDDIVTEVYADTPAQLHPVARYSALAHLEKMASEGRAKLENDRWRLIDV